MVCIPNRPLGPRAAIGEHEVDRVYADLDIEHRLTPPKSPQMNGMVERCNHLGQAVAREVECRAPPRWLIPSAQVNLTFRHTSTVKILPPSPSPERAKVIDY